MATEDEIAVAQSVFSAARVDLFKCVPGKPGFNAEAKYGEAYHRLVIMGAMPKLKQKYSRGR